MLQNIDNANLIIVLALLLQSIGGIGCGINNSSSMALLSSYEENRDDYIGYLEASAGMGALLGPLIGSILYSLFGFHGPFTGVGFCTLIIVTFFFQKKN